MSSDEEKGDKEEKENNNNSTNPAATEEKNKGNVKLGVFGLFSKYYEKYNITVFNSRISKVVILVLCPKKGAYNPHGI